MRKRIAQKIQALLLVLTMLVSILTPAAVYAEEPEEGKTSLVFQADSSYAVVNGNKAINVKAVGWQTRTTVDGIYVEESNKISNQSLLKITPLEDQTGLAADEVKVRMDYAGIEGESYPIRTEGGNTFVFADADKRADACTYVIKKTGEHQGIIQDTTRNYYFSIQASGEIERVADASQAAVFQFVENPVVTDFTLYIEHKATGKYIKANGIGEALTVDGEALDGVIGDDLRWTPVWGEYNGRSVTFNSKAMPDSRWRGGNTAEVIQIAGKGHGGWESIRVVPNGNGTISFQDTADGKFFTVSNNKITKTNNSESSDVNGEFIIHSVTAPEAVTNIQVSEIDDTAVTVSWEGVVDTFYTGYKVVATPSVVSGKDIVTSEETATTSIHLEGLTAGTEYTITVLTVNAENPFATSEGTVIQTANGPRPVQVTGLKAEEDGEGIKVEWRAVDEADSYDVYRAVSAFAGYTKVAENVEETSYTDHALNAAGKYSNYYKIVAKNENGASEISDEYTSLEKEMFGENTLIFAETDDTVVIDRILGDLFTRQNNANADAQFKSDHYQVYFKPGDYTDTSCMYLGFYTAFNGLGETPYDVKLNNIAIPAYLSDNNATCNFWRSTENVSVINTGNAQGKAQFGSWRADQFNWAVAQAAPLRRVYSQRPIAYDWNYGWASGGYVADCYIEGTFTDNGNPLSAGTFSGQQFYTRNSVLKGNAYGTTLNNFFQGVEAPNLPNAETGSALVKGNGYSNWAAADASGNQQVFTNIEKTPKLSEKPFLYLDKNGEYQVFVPAIRENTSGVSWTEDNMGEGTSIALDKFYIAKPTDTAAVINAQLNAGKNIYFTPGIYHAETPIKVTKAGTILLGTGLATIIPDNEEAAMEIADVDGVKVAGLIFDAGEHSKYLLKVGEAGTHTDHADHPIVLQDLFFRVGGTTDVLTKADDALEINSDDVIVDHFWIWRADHGAGVAWYGNESKHGLIVNGDDVTCYALFNEHFQDYTTLWNGENGATYFYQNETAYDPISQEAWMSHFGKVNGYASYKVSNNVKKHYAVGLGIYNVFINTGEEYDSSKVQIQLDNAIEVPNAEGVLIENACLQTFAKADGALQKIRSIVNGVGAGVASGIDIVTGETGPGWARTFLISYNNGTAVTGRFDRNQAGKYLGKITTENVQQPMNEEGDVDLTVLEKLYSEVKDYNKADYTSETWEVFAKALAEVKAQLDKGQEWAVQEDVDAAEQALRAAVEALVKADKPLVRDIFIDINEGDWFEDSVQYVYDNGIMTGLDSDIFGPAESLQRSQFATIIWRMEGSPKEAYEDMYPDVPEDKFYTQAVLWGTQAGVLTGYAEGIFGPDDQITREQMVTIMFRYAKIKGYDVSKRDDLATFPDADSVSGFAKDAVSWAVAEGLIQGDNGKLNPLGTTNRAQAVAVIERFKENIEK